MVKVLTASLGLWLVITLGCDKETEHAKSGSSPAVQKPEHGQEAGSHEGHEHGTEVGGHEHHAGPKHDLGTTKVGELVVAVGYSGTITPGHELDIDLAVKDNPGKLAAVRAWIGTQDAKGSMKAKAMPEGEGYHAEVEVPEPLHAGSALWIEIESVQGSKQLGSVQLRQVETKGAE